MGNVYDLFVFSQIALPPRKAYYANQMPILAVRLQCHTLLISCDGLGGAYC